MAHSTAQEKQQIEDAVSAALARDGKVNVAQLTRDLSVTLGRTVNRKAILRARKAVQAKVRDRVAASTGAASADARADAVKQVTETAQLVRNGRNSVNALYGLL